MTRSREAALESLNAEFLLGADIARLIALNAALEASRAGEDGTAAMATATSSNELVNRALASSGEAARLLRDTLGNCALPLRRD